MGMISLTADRVNVSYQGRVMIAAAAMNAVGVDIDETNISKTTAWRKANQVRTEIRLSVEEKEENDNAKAEEQKQKEQDY